MSVVRVSENYFKGIGGELGRLGDHKARINLAMGKTECSDLVEGKTIDGNLLESPEYQRYQQDETYRWIIRNFLMNSVLSGTISQSRYDEIISVVKTYKGRESIVASLMRVPAMNADDIELMYSEAIGSE